MLDKVGEELSVFSQIDNLGSSARDLGTDGSQAFGELEWGLSAKVYNDAVWIFQLYHMAYMLEVNRLKVEDIRGVIVCGDGFGIAVVHDGLDTHILQRKGRMHTAVVKLNTLTDTVGAATDYQDLAVFGIRN